MGVNYTVFVYDDFDWKYANTDKEKEKAKLLKDLAELNCTAEVLADFYHYIILDLKKKSPNFGKINELLCNQDMVYFCSCHDPQLVRLERWYEH